MMFHNPGMVIAEPVGGLQLGQRILIKLEFVAGVPGTWQLQLIENAEFHHVSPGDGLFSQNTVFWCGAESSLGQFRAAEAGLRRACEWLVSAGSRVVASANDVFPHREIMPTFTPHQDSALMAVADWLKAKPGKKGTPP